MDKVSQQFLAKNQVSPRKFFLHFFQIFQERLSFSLIFPEYFGEKYFQNHIMGWLKQQSLAMNKIKCSNCLHIITGLLASPRISQYNIKTNIWLIKQIRCLQSVIVFLELELLCVVKRKIFY
jgi:hypothetical protein